MSNRNPARKVVERPPETMELEKPSAVVYVPTPVPVTAQWSAPVSSYMLVGADDRLFLVRAELWKGERDFTVLPDALQPVPVWDELTAKVTPAMVSTIMLRSGIIDADTLVDRGHLSHFFQNMVAAYAEALRGAK